MRLSVQYVLPPSVVEPAGGRDRHHLSSLEKSDEGYIVYFSVKVPIHLKDTDLSALLELTARVAGQKEADLFNTDDE